MNKVLFVFVIACLVSCGSREPFYIEFDNQSAHNLFVLMVENEPFPFGANSDGEGFWRVFNHSNNWRVNACEKKGIYGDDEMRTIKSQYFYIVSADSLSKYGWMKCILEERYLQKYVLYKNKKSFDRNSISYPPAEDMKLIEMYPQYGSQEYDRTCNSSNE